MECEFAKKTNSSFSGILGFSVTKYGKINFLIVLVHLGWYNQISWIRYLINNRNLFLRVPEYRKSKIKILADAMSDEDFFQKATFSSCPHVVGGVREFSGISFTGSLTNLIHEDSPFMTKSPPKGLTSSYHFAY